MEFLFKTVFVDSIEAYLDAVAKGCLVLRYRGDKPQELLRELERRQNDSPEFKMEYGKTLNQGELGEKNDALSFRLFCELAEEGYAPAMNCVGYCYGTGTGVEKDEATAAKWFEKSAAAGFIGAYDNIAFLYQRGVGGYEKNREKALENALRCANAGMALAQSRVAFLYSTMNDVQHLEEAIIFAKRALEQEDKPLPRRYLGRAYGKIGYHYSLGTGGVSADFDKAFAYTKLGAAEKDVDSYFALGRFYHRGIGTPVDLAQAHHYYELARAEKQWAANYRLGEMYERGQGVEQDYARAFSYYQEALENGYEDPFIYRNLAYLNKDGNGVEKDEKKAVECFKKAAEGGVYEAMYMLGNEYALGTFIEKDPEKAFYWISKSTAGKSPRAYYLMGLCYLYGTGVEKDAAKAREWLEKSAAGSFTPAKECLEKMK